MSEKRILKISGWQILSPVAFVFDWTQPPGSCQGSLSPAPTSVGSTDFRHLITGTNL